MRRVALWWLLGWGTLGCNSGGSSTDAGDDAPSACRTDTDCSDGLFCNGEERCAPGAGADARGCVAGAMACPLRECDEATRTCGDACPDRDGDGSADVRCGGTDCDDDDPNVHPDATEVCDAAGVDEDCDPSTVSGPEGDADGDGFYAERCCNGDECGTDCNDEVRAINPGSLDVCGGGDQDCDGSIDENPDETFYRDRDGDGFGIEGDTVIACSAPGGYAVIPGDCDDTQRNFNPSTDEECDGEVDEDCDGSVDEDCPCAPEGDMQACDTDAAGVGVCRAGNRYCTADGWTSCIDSVVASPEVCNADLRDEDCDAAVDEGCACINGTTRRCGVDTGRCQSVLQTCASGAWPRTCEEQAGVIYPTTEICNGGVDDDCDGVIDEGCSCTNGTTQACGSTVGACRAGTQTCSSGMWGTCSGGTGPTTEVCNSSDDDCDGVIDEVAGVGAVCGTNQGTCRQGTQQCSGGALVCGGTHVGPAAETCNHLNDDCDSRIDEGLHRTCDWDSTTRTIANARSSFHACQPGCPGTSTSVIRRLIAADDSTRRGLYMNSGDLVDWGGSTFRAIGTFLYTRTATRGPLAHLVTTITPSRTVGTGSALSRTGALPTVPPGRRGYAAVYDQSNSRVYLYRLTAAGPVQIAASTGSVPTECRMSATNPTMRALVQLEGAYGRLRAWLSVWGPPGCDVDLFAEANESDWETALYGTSNESGYMLPRYEIGVIADPVVPNGTVDLEAFRVQRLAPVTIGTLIGDGGHCVACPSSWL